MIAQYSPIVFLMLISGIISAALAFIGWQNRAIPISKPFTLLMVAETVWIFGYVLEMMSTSLSTVLLFNNLEYPAIMTVPVAWLFVVLCFTGREQYVTRYTVPIFFIVPVLACILVFTNPLHHLYYSGFSAVTLNGSVIWIYEHGPLFWVAIGYSYLISLVSLVLVSGRAFVRRDIFQRQTILLIIASSIPVLCNMGYVFQLAPFPGYDLTPVAFMITGLVLAIGLLHYQLFSAVPVAYSRVFLAMRDGVIVTNSKYQVIDLNPAAGRIISASPAETIGKNIGDFLPRLAFCELPSAVSDPEKRIEIMIPHDSKPRYYDVLVTPMGDRTGPSSGHLILFRDITDRKQSELVLASAHKKINLLSGITRHDINNKLQAVQNYLELTRIAATDPVQIDYIDREEMAVHAIQEQIEFSREYEQIGVDAPIWDNVDACVKRTLPQVDTKNVTITCTTGTLEIFADPMCEKVCYNLLDNAMRYGGAGLSKITISAQASGSDMLIIVEDDGEGIAPADKDHLFERGFGKNTGLGLFLSREILSITEIGIRETGTPGHGAHFEIRVPEGKFRFGE